MPTAWPIQFASGAKPGVKMKISKAKTEIETKQKRKKYEKDKRPARTFNIKWKEGRDWLVFYISSCLTLFSDIITKASFCVWHMVRYVLICSVPARPK